MRGLPAAPASRLPVGARLRGRWPCRSAAPRARAYANDRSKPATSRSARGLRASLRQRARRFALEIDDHEVVATHEHLAEVNVAVMSLLHAERRGLEVGELVDQCASAAARASSASRAVRSRVRWRSCGRAEQRAGFRRPRAARVHARRADPSRVDGLGLERRQSSVGVSNAACSCATRVASTPTSARYAPCASSAGASALGPVLEETRRDS